MLDGNIPTIVGQYCYLIRNWFSLYWGSLIESWQKVPWLWKGYGCSTREIVPKDSSHDWIMEINLSGTTNHVKNMEARNPRLSWFPCRQVKVWATTLPTQPGKWVEMHIYPILIWLYQPEKLFWTIAQALTLCNFDHKSKGNWKKTTTRIYLLSPVLHLSCPLLPTLKWPFSFTSNIYIKSSPSKPIC